jgi:hypothetical protein
MKAFSNDSDILRYEPVLFGDLYLRVNLVAAGTGAAVSGTRLTAPGASFISAGVQAGGAVYLSNAAGTINGVYEIVSVDSPTELTISIVRNSRDDPARPPAAATDVAYRVCSYAPQANEVFVRLCAYFGIAAEQAAAISDTSVLREASVYLTMAMVFTAIASREGYAQQYLDKSDFYTGRFLKALDRCAFTVNPTGKTAPRNGSTARLIRD